MKIKLRLIRVKGFNPCWYPQVNGNPYNALFSACLRWCYERNVAEGRLVNDRLTLIQK